MPDLDYENQIEKYEFISGQIARKVIVPVPSFNEYVNAAPKGCVWIIDLNFNAHITCRKNIFRKWHDRTKINLTHNCETI